MRGRQNGFRSFRWNIEYCILSGLHGLHKEIVSLILFFYPVLEKYLNVVLVCTFCYNFTGRTFPELHIYKCRLCMKGESLISRSFLISETKIKETSHQGCNPNQFRFIAQLIHICKCLSAGRYINSL